MKNKPAFRKPCRKPCVIANWKMHGSKVKNQNLINELLTLIPQLTETSTSENNYENNHINNHKSYHENTIDIFLSPPAAYLEQVAGLIQNSVFQLAAQNVYCEEQGAFTGEISPSMLVDLGCSAVIIGHSERRLLLAEDNDLIARKFLAAYHMGLIPILCVGETRQERENGKTLDVIRHQVMSVLNLARISTFESAMIAYEPVWAIGTGIAASPEDAEEVQAFIRRLLAEQDAEIAEKTRILYGGSVNGAIAKDLFVKPDIDGGLIGGASLVAQDFLSICKAAKYKATMSN